MNSELAFPDELSRRLHLAGVIAVLVIDDADHAVPIAEALAAGGVEAIELTLRTPVAWESLRRIRAAVPQLIVGMGTVLTEQQVRQAVDEGAAFGVSPGLNPATVAAARRAGLAFAPGVCTPSDIELAVSAGCRLLKFFPSAPLGGLPYLRSIAAPFQHLGVQFIPLGGLNEQNAAEYFSEPLVHSIGGSWLAPRELQQGQQWDVVRQRAGAVVAARQRAVLETQQRAVIAARQPAGENQV